MIEGIDLEINDLVQNENDGEGREHENEKDKGETSVRVKPRRVVRNPQPKLNPERLGGSRGLVQLPKIFSEVHLKGEGHEKENLDVVMKTLEHWSYRLFPRFPFDDVLEKIEKLGAKKQVQTCLKKIRLDMITDEDFAPLRDEVSAASPPPDLPSNDDLFNNIFNNQTAHPICTRIAPTPVNNPSSTLTCEQIERIERNRRLALELRAAKLQQAAVQQNETVTLDLGTRENEKEQVEDDRNETNEIEMRDEERKNDTEMEEKTNETEMLNDNELLAFLDDGM